MDKPKIVSKCPIELTIHPLAALLPEWARDDERFLSLVEDVRLRGIDQLLTIDPEGRIVDGRARWRAAKQLQLLEVDCKVVGHDEVAGVVLNSLLQRKHYTKGALAYIAFPLLEDGLKESNRRKLENLRKGNVFPKVAQGLSGKNTEQFAESLGFGKLLFYQARDIHAAFAKTPALKAVFEPKILVGEIGLGACLAGIAGKEATDGKSKRVSEQLELFEDAFDTLKTRFCYWQKFNATQKSALRPVLKKTVEAMPADLREELAAALKAASKETK